MHKKLIAEKIRTGFGPSLILNAAAGRPPTHLTPPMVSQWQSGRTKYVRSDLWNYIMKAYTELPSVSHTAQKQAVEQRVAITPEFKAKLELWRRSGLLLVHFFDTQADDLPVGLSRNMVANWLSGISSTTIPAYLEYVRNQCAALMEDEETSILVTKFMRISLRRSWSNIDQTQRQNLSARLVGEVDEYLTNTKARVHPKRWLDVLNLLDSLDGA